MIIIYVYIILITNCFIMDFVLKLTEIAKYLEILSDKKYEEDTFYIDDSFDIDDSFNDNIKIGRKVPPDDIFPILMKEDDDEIIDTVILIMSDFTIERSLIFLIDHKNILLEYKVGPQLLKNISNSEDLMDYLLNKPINTLTLPIQPIDTIFNTIINLPDKIRRFFLIMCGVYISNIDFEDHVSEINSQIIETLKDDVIQKGIILYNNKFILYSSISNNKLKELIRDLPICLSGLKDSEDTRKDEIMVIAKEVLDELYQSEIPEHIQSQLNYLIEIEVLDKRD